MTQAEVLRAQHDAALAVAHRLLELVDSYRPGQSAVQILMQVNQLFGLLRIHFAQEDELLYPALAASRDQLTARIAKGFFAEMGGLALELEDFTRQWCCSASIATRFEEFREGVHTLVIAIATRIDRENKFLLPLAAAESNVPLQRSAA